LSAGDTRAGVLAAAAAVMRRGGPGALTLEAVAAEAGTGKGGLLAHFATKEQLVEALVTDWLDRLEADTELFAGDRCWPLGYVLASESARRSPEERSAHVALLAALVSEPERLAGIRARWQAWQDRLAEDAADPATATVVRLAADGLWLADLLGLAPPRGPLRQAVVGRLIELSGSP
jgi:AcrR family transcriptional regulator